MHSFYSDKNICLRIRVSHENQDRMKKHIDASFSPLFALKKEQHYTLMFAHKTFTCSYLKTKKAFSYQDVQKAETTTDGVILYLSDDLYIAISTESGEKHNTALYDIVTLLKRRCRSFSVREPIVFPEDASDGRYVADKDAKQQVSFSLTDAELLRLVRYDYLFGERMLAFIVPGIVFLLLSILLLDIGLLVVAGVIAVFCLVLSRFFFKEADGYIRNHQGRLVLLMYDELLVVHFRHTDLELEYRSMKQKKAFWGLWRLKCGDFFTLVLPQRIVEENPVFFSTLEAKIK